MSELIFIPGERSPGIVPANCIVRLQGLSNYSRVYFADGSRLVVSKTLGWFQRLLPASSFVRVHKSHLVNKAYVVDCSGEGKQALSLLTGEHIMISRRKRSMAAKSLHTN